MDQMSLFSILTASLPESFLNLLFGFLVIGERKLFLPTSIKKIFKMFITFALMEVVSYFVRANITISGLTLLLQVICSAIIVKLIYTTKYEIVRKESKINSILYTVDNFLKNGTWKAVACITMAATFLISVEVAVAPPVAELLGKNAQQWYSNDIIRLMISLPIRIIQCAAITILWRIDITLIDLRKYEKMQTYVTVIYSILTFIELSIAAVIVQNIGKADSYVIYGGSLICMALVIVNIIIFRFITLYSYKVIEVESQIAQEKENEISVFIDKFFNIINHNKS